MKYRFWIYQEDAPPHALAGNPRAPKPTDPIAGDLRHPGREAEGVTRIVDQIMEVFEQHGVDDENEKYLIRDKATAALLRGSYRTSLPTPGRWLLAEPVQETAHYAFQINGGRLLVGSADEIRPVIIGALLAAGFSGPVSVKDKAADVLRQVDALPAQVHTVKLASVGDLSVWRDGLA
ncbi:hypothetical protein SEA_KRADAL_287 [Streptomyces phage Kradal]|nr:hypothetical protein SEA_KRADAL_287 [Streptomyces phage Kradal]QPL14595.1 hypothetical protein SEA_EHYELIMAYOE_290 [Streptomyces phage EhyElimayoE]